jgi:predicted ester cyclase
LDSQVERNKANYRRMQLEGIVGGDPDVLRETRAPNAVIRRAGNAGLVKLSGWTSRATIDKDGFERPWESAKGAFTDQVRTIDAMHGEGNTVWVRLTIESTHSGDVYGIPATGKRVKTTEVGEITFDDSGRMVEAWYIADELGLLEQLGVKVELMLP